MNIFFDTEFTGLHKNTTLISIGLIADNGERFYAEFSDYDKSQVDAWLQENVINKLWYNDRTSENVEKGVYNCVNFCEVRNTETNCFGDTPYVGEKLSNWLSQFDEIKMWSDCLAYDWMLFCNIFGSAFDIPKNVYYIPFDLATLLLVAGFDPDIKREELADIAELGYDESAKHNSAFDALVIKLCYEKICYNAELGENDTLIIT